MAFDMSDYVDVSERLAHLFAKHPEASLRGTYEFITIGDQMRVVYRAECYRTPDDPAPAVGTAWEDIPGKTPYTKGSELQNAETSAWGRAIVAAGASTSKRIASADEMRSAQERQNADQVRRSAPPAPEKSAAEGAVPQVRAVEVRGTTSAAPSAVSKARREKLKSRCVALQADGVSVADAREKLRLPLVDSCDENQLAVFESLVDELEGALKAPFAEANR